MKVTRVGGDKKASSVQRVKSDPGRGAEFAEHLKEAAAAMEAGGAAGTASVNSVDAILSVQEVPDATQGRSKGLLMEYGSDLLDQLENLRRDLLAGVVLKEKLSSMAQKMRAQRRLTDDVGLNAIIDEIELRAEVEIAKLTRPMDGERKAKQGP